LGHPSLPIDIVVSYVDIYSLQPLYVVVAQAAEAC
jgi:hypothetical protein